MKKIILFSFSFFISGWVFSQTKDWGNSTFYSSADSSLLKKISNKILLSDKLNPKVNPDGNGILNPSYFAQNVCGLNYVQASKLTETRSITAGYNTNGSGFPATLTVSGLPATCVVIQKAYLYYSASYTELTAPGTTATITNPIPSTATYPATVIGTGPAKGWGETGAAAYRADVTAAIAGNGVYTVNLTGFANADWEVDGITLIIIYTSGPTTNGTGSLILIDGMISTAVSNATENVSGFSVCNNAPAAAFGVYGDIQANDNGNINTDIFNGTTSSFANNFWNFNQIVTAVTAGQSTTQFESYTNNGTNASDAYAWIMAGIYWQNTGCVNCVPTIVFSNINPTCGNSNGSSEAIVTGGTPPYTYTWAPSGQTNATATGLSGGTFTVTVEDAICNTATATVTLVNTPSVVVTANATQEISCNGGANGIATATVTSGSSPYSYLWLPSGNTHSSISGLSAGTYTIDITDSKGCTGSATVTITQPQPITAVISGSANVSCFGGSNGSATVTPNGGTPTYTYLWSPGGNTNATATGLSIGTYSVTVTDSNGCISTASVTITQPPKLTAVITAHSNELCAGESTGSATITATGGTPSYTYFWIPGGNTTSTYTGLSTGVYTVTVTDSNGCTASARVNVTQPPRLIVTISLVNNLTCNGAATGSIAVTPTGGTPAYTYLWTPGGNTNSAATGLSAGTYTVTVTDKNGCTATATATITQPPPFTSAITSFTDISCFGVSDGSATVTVGGGVPAYTYSWAPSGGSNSNASGLSAGSYTVTVTDANGCTSSATVTLTQPATMNPSISSIVNVSCNGGNTGSMTVTQSGGTAPYTYLWNPSGQTDATASGLSAGSYTVTITDARGCSETTSATITQPPPLTTNLSSTIGCGANSGTLTATVAGGTPAYTYLWNPGGGTTATITGLSSGTYTLISTDANGCSQTNTITITQPPLLTSTLSVTNVLCTGGNTGSASINATGGTPAYTYLWTPGGQTTSAVSGLSSGSYTVTVTDAAGCTSTSTFTITQPPTLTLTLGATTNVTCNGGSNGSANITAIGGSPAYTYQWLPGGNSNSNATGLQAGQYTVTVTDANGCMAVDSVIITQPPPLIADSTVISQTTCNNSNGNATVYIGGGTPGYTYLWTPGGQTTSSVSGLSDGTYSVTVTDANGCSITVPVTVTNAQLNIVAGGAIFCSGGNTATVTVNVNGGSKPYTYLWNPGGQTTAIVTGLSAGTYTVSVTDSTGCTLTATITISQPPPLTLRITNLINLKCNSDSSGSATVIAGGGSAPYFYFWKPNGNTTSTVSGLSAGTYTVYAIDTNGCFDSILVTITQPAGLTVNITSGGQIPCFGGVGATAIATVSGGLAPYTYQWYPGGGTTATITGLSAGIDSVVVTDANNCTGYATIIITQPPPLQDSLAALFANCANNNGSIQSLPSGGTGPYGYNWAPGGQSTAVISGLSAGSYTVTVTDANGCTIKDSTTVKNAYDSIKAVGGVTCFGGSDGTATVTELGGNPPYTYLWTPTGQTTATASGLSSGVYTVQVTDSLGCTVTAAVNITQPAALSIPVIINNNALCAGGSTGSATVTPAGGRAPYTYLWNPGGNSTATATGLSAGNYTVTVIDSGGCSMTTSLTITQPLPLKDSITAHTNLLCHVTNTGSATVISTGGVPAYTYLWTPGGKTTSTVTGLSAGIYTVQVTDANGCTATVSVSITQPPQLTATFSAFSDISCNNANDGSATAKATGGTGAYTYSWNPGGSTNSSISGLSVGTYTITITDANGCDATNKITITQPPSFICSITSIANVSCTGGLNGTATAVAAGGTPAYTYLWTPGGNSNATATGFSAGTYTVTITDSKGCSTTDSVTITQPPVLSLTLNETSQVVCNGGITGAATSTVIGGTTPYTYNWLPGGNTNANASGLSAGTYTLTVSDNNGCSVTASVTFTQPPAITLTISNSTNIKCHGGATGSATITATGGVSPYTYAWNPGGNTTSTATGLSAGTYTMTVTDANGCVATTSVTLTQPAVLNVNITSTNNLLCNNAFTGSATAAAHGGKPAYNYIWTPGGQTNATATGLGAGSYTVTVTDFNGCTASVGVTITQPPLLKDSATTTPTTCGSNSGTATSIVTGGTPINQYLWTPGGNTNAFATGLSAGSYTLTVIDGNGCVATTVANVYNSAPTLKTSTFVSCFGGNNGTATVSIGGGNPPYTYLWSPIGQTNATATGLSAGTYTVDIKDAGGCNVIDSVTITQPPLLVVSIGSSVNVTCNGGATGNITALVTGGTPSYFYTWSPGGQTTAGITGLTAGTYTLLVTDGNGCTGKDSVTITQPPLLSVNILSTSNINCNGGNNGSANVVGVGGTPAYTYLWTPGGMTTANISGLTSGTYTVTVTDNNGCIATDSITITQPAPLVANINSINVNCSGPNSGSATVIVSGGTPAYAYSWSPNTSTTANATGLSAGNYTVNITDLNGCTTSATVTITQAAPLVSTITSFTNVLCNGGATGSATATVTGGTAPYTYSWLPGGNSNSTATGLSAGTYSLTVTDFTGCTTTNAVVISQPPALTISLFGTNITCNGEANGSATVTVGGGSPGYIYAWTPAGGTNANASNLSAATYTITATDANGCIIVDSTTITQPAPLAVSNTFTNVSCGGGSNGSATVTITGGTPAYTYSWSPAGGTNATASNLSAASYTVSITDANACSITDTITITQPTPLNLTASSTTANCSANNGSASVVVTGGTPVYTYSWNPGGGTTANITGLSGGIYTVTVTDANSCIATDTTTVTQLAGLSISISNITNVLCNGGNTGSATVAVTGGVAPYTYAWTPSGGSNATATGLTAGIYTITVTDKFGCSAIDSAVITQPPVLVAIMGAPTNILCSGGNNASATVTVTGGTSPYVYNWSPTGGTNATGTGMTAGTYTVHITDVNGCIDSSLVTITQPTVLTLSLTATNISCFGNNNGSISATAGGGVSPYAFSWAPGGNTNNSISNLSAGSYTLTLTDANGCIATLGNTITQPGALSLSLTGVNVSCHGGSNASITANVTGGTIPYSYSWSPVAGTNATINGLSIGTYSVTVTDANNCSVIDSIRITQPPPLGINASGPQSICYGTSATLTSTARGGVTPYTYLWSSGATTDTANVTPLSTTSFTVTVTDANGCQASAKVTVAVGTPLSLVVKGDTAVCPGQSVYLSVQAYGGDGVYHYTWLPGSSTLQWASFVVRHDTTVTVEVTDNCGTTMLVRIIHIIANPVPDIQFLSNPDIGCAPLCVQFKDESTISSGYITQWQWNFGNGDSSHAKDPVYCYNDTGNYSVTLTAISSNGCSSTLKVINLIKVYDKPKAAFTYSPNPIDIMNPQVQFTDNSFGKYPIAEWNWLLGDGATSYEKDPSHTYSDTGTYCATLIVTDIHGCVDSITNCLIVSPLFTLYIPDAFSPNGDGVNDFFMPKGTYIKDFEMYIYDRWGMQLFHSDNIMNGWNGTVRGGNTICQEDSYVYQIYVTDTRGNKHAYNGVVTLIK